MLRKFALAALMFALSTPVGVYALGLGDLHPRSTLNQTFNGYIELLSVTPDDLASIRVKLASAEAFAEAGVARPYILTSLTFTAEATADGRAVIRVTSREPIREPYLNFLVEVNWPRGKLLREYTVLLDPPVTLGRKPAAVDTASAVSQAAAPATGATTVPRRTAPAARAGDGEYGPTQRNDTLWNIASNLRPEGVSVQQMMMALLSANPHAFFGNNVNNLKAGEILRVPARDEIETLSPAEARQAFAEQMTDWRKGRVSPAPATVVGMAPAEGRPDAPSASEDAGALSEEASRLEIARAEQRQAEPAPPVSEAAPGAEDSAASLAERERVAQELLLLREEAETARQENTDLQSRVFDLQDQLESLNRLLSLKDQELAQLQAAQAVAEQERAVAVTAQPEPEPIPAEQPVAEAAPLDVEEPVTVVVEEERLSAEPVEPPAEVPAAEETPVVDRSPPLEQVDVTFLDEAERQPTLLEQWMADPAVFAGSLVAIVAVIGTLVWLVLRRSSSRASFEESILSTTSESENLTFTGGAHRAGGDSTTDESSFLSDFSPSDIDALQEDTGEVDPVSEADVYIAYGRYQQAEDLIRQAIERHPHRTELKRKLLEVYHASKNKSGFVELASELKAEGVDQDAQAWPQIQAMGAELAPEHSLFSSVRKHEATAGGAARGTATASVDAELDDLEFDIGDLELGGAAESKAESRELDHETLDFDLGRAGGGTPTATTAPAEEPMKAETADIDFDLGDFAPQAGEQTTENLTAVKIPSMEDEELQTQMRDAEDDAYGIGTKLDLARAYIDMGDRDGARNILEEVMKEGSDAQRRQAEELIGRIS